MKAEKFFGRTLFTSELPYFVHTTSCNLVRNLHVKLMVGFCFAQTTFNMKNGFLITNSCYCAYGNDSSNTIHKSCSVPTIQLKNMQQFFSIPRQKNFDKKYLVFVMFQHLLLFDFWMTQIHGLESVFHVWNAIMTKTFLRRDRQRPGRKFIKQNFEWMSRREREKTEKWTFRVDVKKIFYDKWVFFLVKDV